MGTEIKFEEYTGDVITGRGKKADDLSVTLKAALESALESGKPRVLRGLDEDGRKTAKGRLPNMAARLLASLSIGYSPDGDLVISAKPKAPESAEETPEAAVEPVVEAKPTPAKATRPAAKK